MFHLFEIHRNAEGSKLAYLSPIVPDTEEVASVRFRIAGPTAFGGSTNLADIKVHDKDLVQYIKGYAPHLIEELTKK